MKNECVFKIYHFRRHSCKNSWFEQHCLICIVTCTVCTHANTGFTFMITVAVQGFGTLILLLILPVVPQESKLAHDKPDKDTDSVGHASESLQAPSSSEADPLLIN
eukprot:m.1031447 g.1031447  ORF g.1031447 m.1031447 type:complete len:106 (-) comp24122_c0_seq11:2937-3254(-)